MKAESTEEVPAFNIMKHDGIRPQAHNKVISRVLLTDGKWYAIVPGSFKFYKTSPDKAVPFVQFDYERKDDSVFMSGGSLPPVLTRVEVFPASVAGWAYAIEDENV